MGRVVEAAIGVLVLVTLAAAGCASNGKESPNGGSSGGGGGGGGVGDLTGGGTGGTPLCDDAGQCSCIRIASIGQPAHYGVAGLNSDSTEAFTDWLNSKSTAAVDMYTTKPTLTSDFLAPYSVVILQWLTDSNTGPYWSFSSDEVTALQNWVQAGGGIVALSGYDASSQEVVPLNQLLSFTDLSYNMDDVLGTCPANVDCYCWGNSVPLGNWSGAIGNHVMQVGAFHGRSINPGSATVDCADPAAGTVYAAHEAVGQGRVLLYTDEWITYSSQWLGTSSVNSSTMYTDPNNPCYDKSAAEVFQVPQLWFNMLFYASNKNCFMISDPGISN